MEDAIDRDLARTLRSLGVMGDVLAVADGSFPVWFEAIASAARAGSVAEVESLAHTVHGSAAQLGAVELAARACQIERLAGAAAKPSDLEAMARELPDLWATARALLSA